MSLSRSPSSPTNSELEPKQKPPRRKFGLGLLLTLLLAGGGIGFAYWYNSRTSAPTQQSAAPPAIPVKIQTVKSETVEDSSSYVGTLDAQKAVVLRPKTTGRVTQIYVSEGARVQRGTPIVELSPARTRAELNSAIANINAARSGRENANAIREDLQDTRVVAPIAGIVGNIPIKLGDYVDIGDELTTITQNQTLELDLTIPLTRADELRGCLKSRR
jgi:multidrug efflux pump subunit AcrA (membrane-fusion protein)